MAEPWRTISRLTFTGRAGPRWIFSEAHGQARLIVSLLDDGVIRVQVQPLGHATVARTWSIVGPDGDTGPEGRDREDLTPFSCPEPLEAGVSDGFFVLRTSRLHLRLDLASAAIAFFDPDGSPLLADHATLAYRTNLHQGERGIRHTLQRHLNELYLGLGEVSGPLNKHHRRYRLRPTDALAYDAENADPLYKHMPVYLTVTEAGCATGLLYDTGAEAVFDFGREVDNYQGLYRYAEFQARELDYYVLAGPQVASVTRRIQQLTGFAPVPPRWSLAYQGSTMSYTESADPTAALAGFVERCRVEGIPLGGFNLSSGYSLADDGQRYVFRWHRRRVPEPNEMTRAFRDAGVRTLANIKPALLTSHPDFAHLAEQGAFAFASETESPYLGSFWGGLGAHLDFTNPVAFNWWRDQVREQILEQGIDATWNDNNEFQISDDEVRLHAGTAGDLRPVLTLLMNMASREAQRQHAPELRDYQLTRSGALGTQRYAQTWSGDNYTSWNTLRYNLPMGLGMSLSGWANHGHDVGGFAGPMPDEELLLRWVEAGVFQPRFCIHSWNDDGSATEPWTHPAVLPHIRRLMRFRQALIPYLYTLAVEASFSGTPITRPFVHDFQDWEPGRRESFAFMLGDALLVAPVLESGAVTRSQLLPPGRWLELQTGIVHQGGRTDGRPAELAALPGRPPLLLREGSALPLAVNRPPAAGGDALYQDAQAIEWLAFPDPGGNFRGQLVWDDGVSRLEAAQAASRVSLAADGLAYGLDLSGAELPAGFDPCLRVLVPDGSVGLEWFTADIWRQLA